MSNNSVKHWLVLAMCCLLAVVAVGLPVMTAGVFITPIAESLGIYRGTVALHNTMTLIFKAILGLYAPRVIDKFGVKKTLVSASLIVSLSNYFLGWTTSIIIFTILGTLRGIGAGLIAWVPITLLVNHWFEKKNGFVTSIVLSFSSIGGAIFSPVFTSLIASLGWQQAYRMMGVTAFILSLPAMVLSYSLDPKQSGLLPYGASLDQSKDSKKKSVIKRDNRGDLSQELFIIFMIFALMQTLAIGIPQHFPGFAESIGHDQTFGASLMSATMISSIAFKLGAGYVSDRIGSITTTNLIMVSTIIASVMFAISTKSSVLFPAAILMGGVFAIPSVALVLLTKRFFGLYNFAQFYPKVSFAVAIGGSISVSAIGFIYDFTQSYIPAFIGLIIVNVLGLLILKFLSKKYLSQ